MVPSGHLAASITHSQTAKEILKRVFLGSNLLSQSHKFFIPGPRYMDKLPDEYCTTIKEYLKFISSRPKRYKFHLMMIVCYIQTFSISIPFVMNWIFLFINHLFILRGILYRYESSSNY
ncbi:hypothetical protein SADUNF_Sadunf15G0103600 [Salix dunnii]|uniref:Uncharacterized protein n=1 Tax=Salix dunnii TaxID=1413687 RepID=A0A835JF21_9ROSI|nr:hypothetical protein SADUNF_Sadunf15G0103600 [Salix dunnii]